MNIYLHAAIITVSIVGLSIGLLFLFGHIDLTARVSLAVALIYFGAVAQLRKRR